MDALQGTLFALAGAYGAFVLSAVVPWVNAEVLLLSMTPFVRSWSDAAVLVVVATAGQITGKVGIYWVGRVAGDAARLRPGRGAACERWRARMTRRPGSAVSLLFFSATVGVPPFYVLTVLAGVLRVRFVAFLAAGTIGRLLHFGLIAGPAYALAAAG